MHIEEPPTIEKSESALHGAACGGSAQAIALLLDAGADIHAVDPQGWTALHYAASAGHVEAAKLLIERGIDIEHTDHKGHTALYHAALQGKTAMMDTLITAGAHISSTSDFDHKTHTLIGTFITFLRNNKEENTARTFAEVPLSSETTLPRP